MNKYKMKWTIGIVILVILSVGIFTFAYNQIVDVKGTSSLTAGNSVFSGTESENTKLPLFDAETLKTYNGKNNQPSYIAYKGTVYDVSDVKAWRNGTHHGVEAGMDLTDIFSQSPHSESILKEAKVVGVYSTKLLSTTQSNDTIETSKANNSNPSVDVLEVSTSENSSSEAPVLVNTSNVFNATSLSTYNGQNNQPAYIAVSGIVYDVTNVSDWRNGTHNGYSAGQDLTEAFALSPHAQSLLSTLKPVGTYDEKSVVAVQINSKSTETNTQTNKASNNIFTLEMLSAYNGQNNQPAYIAVSGIVYDVTNVSDWRNGTHNGYSAGQDLTNAFAMSPHSQSLLSTLKQVGIIEDTSSTFLQNDSTADETHTQTNMDPTNLISLEMLATFNGQNTQPAYIAVNGVVYDVTSYWRNGQHHGLTAGADMTTAFLNSPHSSSLLAQLPIVGYLPSDQSIINQNVTTKSSGSDDDDDDDDEHDDEHEEDD